MLKRSTHGIVRSALDVKTWLTSPPSCSAVRPSHCPSCGVTGHPLGDRVWLHGHGLVERQQWGPLRPGTTPTLTVILVRRYRCVACSSVCRVVPQGVLARQLYSAMAIVMALALWATAGASQAGARAAVSPLSIVGRGSRHRWRSLHRWTAAAASGRLFGQQWSTATTPRATAEAIVMTLAAHGPPGDRAASVPHRAWQGVLQMA